MGALAIFVPAPYATLWIVIIGARAAFSCGSAHWFTAPLVTWCIAHQVTEAAIVDGPIFMAIAMVLVRAISLGVRASRLPGQALAVHQGQEAPLR